jgi:formamidopyrimidine-DNA glycosylase
MPELPEVQTVLSGLEKALQGKTILSLECFYPGTVITDPSLDFDPFPARPVSFIRRGKYMLIHLEGQASLIIHLRMTGKLVIDSPNSGRELPQQTSFLRKQEPHQPLGDSCLRRNEGNNTPAEGLPTEGLPNSDLAEAAKLPDIAKSRSLDRQKDCRSALVSTDSVPLKHERARFILNQGCLLHFIDIRTFGKIVLCRTENVPNYLPELGLEPLSKDFTPKILGEKLKGKKAPVKTTLLDQGIVAGLGNIYVCELLFRAGISPLLPANELKPKQIKQIVSETVKVLREAIAMGGTSISDFRRIDDITGEFQNFLQVYQKQQCPKGHEVKRIVQAGRATFYCPVCQKG